MVEIYRPNLTPVQVFLTLAVKDLHSRTPDDRARLAALYRQLGDETIWQASAANKIIPYAAHALVEAVDADHLPARWSGIHTWYETRNHRYLEELDDLSCRFDEAGVRVVAVEAGSIFYGVYPCPACFASGDIDLLVDPAQAPVVHTVMQAAGFEPDVQQWDAPGSRQAYCKRLEDDTSLWLVLMWEPLSRTWLAPIHALDQRTLIARSEPLIYRSTCVRLPAAEDHLLLCALHTSIHGYVRPPGLRLHLDVDRVVRYRPLNWDLVVHRASEWQVKKRVFLSLAMAAGLLGTPIPPRVLERLVPGRAEQIRLLAVLAGKSVFNTGSAGGFSRLEFARLEISLDDRGWLPGLVHALFPSGEWMRRRYTVAHRWQLPLWYLRRLAAATHVWRPSA